MDTECSDAESSSSHGVSWSNLTTPCCVQGSRQRHYSRSHDLQNENVLLLVIFQTYGVSSRHDGHSYVCSMGLWFLLRTVLCNCCKRSDTQHGHSYVCSMGLWFLLRTVCCNCCKRSDTQQHCCVSDLLQQLQQTMGLWFLLRTVCCNCCKRSDTQQHCCVSDLLQQLQQTVRRRNQRPIEQTYEWPCCVSDLLQQLQRTWPFIRLFNGPLVSPTYCLLQLLQEIRYTTMYCCVSDLLQQLSIVVYLISCSSCNKQYVGETKGPLNKRMNGHVVYLISCSSCKEQYVGETKGPLNKRMNGHRDDWRHRRFERSPTAEHFHSADHDFLSNASVCCLEHNKEWSDSTRKLRESYWIRRLNTLCPFGINKGD